MSALGALRTGISNFQASLVLTSGDFSFPPLDSLISVGVVMNGVPSPNPFQLDPNAPDSVVEGFVPGEIVGTRGGWAYKPSTGEIWANTSTIIPSGGCGPATELNENTW